MDRLEISKRNIALNDCNISYVLSQKCKESRNVDGYRCGGNCADRFSSISDAFQAVKKIRQSIWIDPDTLDFNFSTNNNSGLDLRKSAFIKAIMNMTATSESGNTVVTYSIGGLNVCKNFYFRATGLSKKLFNRGIAFIISSDNDDQNQESFETLSLKPIFTHVCGHLPFSSKNVHKSKEIEISDNQANVLSFLDLYFKGNVDVDHAPEESNVRYVRLNWTGVYDEYVKHCNLVSIGVVNYAKFTSIR